LENFRKHLIQQGTIIKDVLIELSSLGADTILFVVDSNGILKGSVTDGDIRRGLIKGISIDHPIDDVITTTPKFIRKTDVDVEKIIEYREADYKAVPIVDDMGTVVDIINFRHLHSYLPVDAVIMAGGMGQRLRPLTDQLPKPLLTVGDKPILAHGIDRLCQFGIQQFWISINYLGHKIVEYFGNGDDRNVNISYIREETPLGTIGSISLVKEFKHDYILVSNSDLLTNIDFEHFFMDFLKQGADLAVVTIPYQVNVPYAIFETSEGYVTKLKEKPTYTYYSNGGIYLFRKEVLQYIPENAFFNATDLMEILLKENKKVYSYPFRGYWLDIGNPDDFQKAQQDIRQIHFK
jgi:dTDP-glucose pyrophosphorylase